MNRNRYLFIGGVFLAACLIIIAWAVRRSDDTLSVKSSVGEITSSNGPVTSRRPRTLEFEPVLAPRPLQSQEVIATDRGGEAAITLKTNTVLKLGETTRFVVETDATRMEGLAGTVLEGTVSIVNPGLPNHFRLYYQGKEIPLDQAANVVGPNRMKARSNETANTELLIQATAAPEQDAPPTTEVSSEPTPVVTKTEADTDTLTNQDIIRQLRGSVGFFQRCYLNYINRARQADPASGSNHGNTDGGVTSGAVIMRFRVEPAGRVTEVGVVRSDFKDQTLHHCLQEVIEGARFKRFGGATVPVLEFPIRLQ